jgi:hypothetical protein
MNGNDEKCETSVYEGTYQIVRRCCVLNGELFYFIYLLLFLYYSTVNFIHKLCGKIKTYFYYKCILVLKEITLKTATWVAETCW